MHMVSSLHIGPHPSKASDAPWDSGWRTQEGQCQPTAKLPFCIIDGEGRASIDPRSTDLHPRSMSFLGVALEIVVDRDFTGKQFRENSERRSEY